MTVRERARAFVAEWVGTRVFSVQDTATDALVEEFTSVQNEERRACVAYLCHMAAQTSVALRPIQFLADAVERGMHLEEGR